MAFKTFALHRLTESSKRVNALHNSILEKYFNFYSEDRLTSLAYLRKERRLLEIKEQKPKTESARTSTITWTKLCTKIYLNLIANFCITVSNILSKEIISNNIENKFRSSTDFQ